MVAGALFSLTSTLAGIVSGIVLGRFGEILGLEPRVALASILGLVALAVGVLELIGRRPWLLQYDRETPQSWVRGGTLRWAMWNGGTLGVGAASRIGFWLWYVVPTGAFLLANPLLSAGLYGIYGFVRGTAVWGLVLRQLREGDAGLWLVSYYQFARKIAAAHLVIVATIVIVVVGR